jgi:ATP-dependent Clp protease protease subunit
VRINSPGGQVFEGQTMANLLKQHPANVVVFIDGLAASIASVIAMAGNEIRMANTATMMIHDAAGGCFGSSTDMMNMARLLDTLSGQVRDEYVRKSGQPADKIAALMDAETWMTAPEALALGLCDTIIPAMDVAACAIPPGATFRNVPSRLRPVNQAAPPPPTEAGPRPHVERHREAMAALRALAVKANRRTGRAA